MAYLINRFSGQPLLTLNDGELNTSTSLSLLGKNYIGYGELQNENFIHLLENFAGPNPPPRAISGQTWFDTGRNILNVYDGSNWNLLGASAISVRAPETPAEGSFWYKIPEGALFIFNDGVWTPIGPEIAEGFGVTRARSTVLRDSDDNPVPVILLTVDNAIVALISRLGFTLSTQNPITGFGTLIPGINLSSEYKIAGRLEGNADTATRFLNARTINGVVFDGQSNITIRANPNGALIKGDYLLGSDYNGSVQTTWSVDATPNNVIGKVVARNAAGDFSANNITANLTGDVTGNVNIDSGESTFNVVRANQFIGGVLSGNAFSATKLVTARKINNISFDGTADIDITVDAFNIVGTELNANVKRSNLTQLGELENLKVKNTGITVGAGDRLLIEVSSGVPSIKNNANDIPLQILTADASKGYVGLQVISSAISLQNNGDNLPAITPTLDEEVNLGHPEFKFNKVYFNELVGNVDGNAETASLATRANNISGGAKGSVPYQFAENITSLLPAGISGQVLTTRGPGEPPEWTNPVIPTNQVLTPGQYIAGTGYNGSTTVFWNIEATPNTEAGKIVARDNNGNFSANIVAVTRLNATTLSGSLEGNASSATRLQNSVTINGLTFDGTQNLNIETIDSTKVSKEGDTMNGFLTLSGDPTLNLHAATKRYVDTATANFRFTYGQVNNVGFTNIVGSFNDTSNYFDVFPPSGLTMSALVGFIPSTRTIYFAGDVNADDSMRCLYSVLSDRIRVFVQNTEQRAVSSGNYLAIWSRA